ncbi:Rne/Rng family ribonuclease [Arthrobacter sp. Soil763]|uniref:Rne/Rng family ribonuclease n=1 Tax=Arthrobacter sp. Soil763 TaxID=1736402 RepID=UPI0006FC8C1B|nr:Rne/Rng family ribonuclease [Arthrobacter sp. Soil763]KRE80215.1 ribonuclease E [Arthrobacter sp. Soil763]
MDNDQLVAGNDEATVTEETPESAVAAEAPKKATRTRRKAAPKSAPAEPAPETQPVPDAGADVAVGPEGTAPDSPAAVEAPAAEAKAPARRSRSRKVETDVQDAAAEAAADTTAPAEAPAVADAVAEAPAEAPEKPVRRRASRAKAAPVAAAPEETAPAEPVAVQDAAAEAAALETAAPAPEAEPAAGVTPAPEAAAAAPAAQAAETPAPEAEPDTQSAEAPSPFLDPGAVTSMIFQAPDLSAVVRPTAAAAPAAADETDEEDDEDGEDSGSRRRRRSRGRRGRSRTAGEAEAEGDTEGEAEDSEATLDDGVTSRRRRRRRRGDQDLELTGGNDDDPPNTVTRVRAPRAVSEAPASNRVTSLKGSTRLEAKKQRRRESRDTGRRRTVITEAEFLARRESVDRQMIVRQRDDRIQIGVLEDGVLAEHFVSNTQQDSLIGNVYVGKVQNVLPSMEAAFVDIGRGRNAVLYAGEVNWDSVNLEGKQRRIENALKSGDSVLVQVTKDPIGHKGARLTSQISLPGRYLVYVPGGSMTGISRKLPDVERNRLKRILKDRLPEDAGVIVRTAAEGASEEELTHDINRLRAQWEGIESQSTSSKVLAPELLYGEPDLTIKVVRDVFNEDFSKLIVSGEEAWDTIEAYVTYVAPDLVGRLEKWTKDTDIFAAWRIDEQIHKALDRKVFLPSGGSLVIDRTEAMTVVDVNTGKFTGSGGNLEETVTKNNLEAAEEVVRQLRLRDIGGIIVIDFIDMVLESNRDLVLRRLVECLGRDRTKHQVAEVTSLGLVQMTRKRMGTGLLEVFGEQCEACAGRGVVTHDEPVEHRRANTVAAEHHVPRAEHQPAGRSERKRRRGKGGQGGEAGVSAPAAVHAEPDEAERHAKAEATRAALANIAAAAHAAHLHDGEATAAPDAETRQAALDAAVELASTEEAAGRPAAVLTFGGEQVALPFVEHAQESTQPALTLDLLTEAFANLGDAETGKPAAAAGAAPAQAQAPAADAAPARAAEAAPEEEAAEAAPAAAPSRATRGRGRARVARIQPPSVRAREEQATGQEPVRQDQSRQGQPRQDHSRQERGQAPARQERGRQERGRQDRTRERAQEPARQERAQAPVQQERAQAPVQQAPVRQAPAQPSVAATDTAAPRRVRRNRSASRAQGAANETSVQQREATPSAAAGSVHEAKAPEPSQAAAKPAASEPLILGVGVPASEL